MSEIVLTVEGVDPVQLYGENNAKLNLLRKAYPKIQITSRGNRLKIVGEKKNTQAVKGKFELMVRWLKENDQLSMQTVKDFVNGNNPFQHRIPKQNNDTTIVYGRDGRAIKAKTRNQRRLIQSSEVNDIVFAAGPAGTGKTYTAVALAVRALKSKLVDKIILTRPAVEAGENLGFLPGDLKEKVDPYLRPLYDALDDMIPVQKLNYYMSNRVIEIAPLAFMRGRTLDNAFIILDEAQNSTRTQLKMFLTRLGPSAKCIVTGDLSQVDLPHRHQSGMQYTMDLLAGLDGIDNVFLNANDVVRHRLVKEIIRAFDRDKEDKKKKSKDKDSGNTPKKKKLSEL